MGEEYTITRWRMPVKKIGTYDAHDKRSIPQCCSEVTDLMLVLVNAWNLGASGSSVGRAPDSRSRGSRIETRAGHLIVWSDTT